MAELPSERAPQHSIALEPLGHATRVITVDGVESDRPTFGPGLALRRSMAGLPSVAGLSRVVTPVLLCGATALWIDLGALHRWHHADSLIMVLISLLQWTPFAWELDRHGMFIPLLARPVTSPFANLLVQGFWNVFFGLGIFFLLAHYMLRSALSPLVAAVGVAAFLVLTSDEYRFDYFMVSDSGVWLSLGIIGLLLAEPARAGAGPSWVRRGLALGFILLAHWVSFATALYLGALVVGRTLFVTEDWRTLRRDLRPASWELRDLCACGARIASAAPVQAFMMLGVGYWVGMTLSDLAPAPLRTVTDALPIAEWPESCGRMVMKTWEALAPGNWPWTLASAAILGILLARWCVPGTRSVIAWRPAAALLTAAVALALFTGTRRWVQINGYAPRYLVAPILFAQSALTMLAVVPLGRAFERAVRVGMPVAVGALLLGSAALSYGWPSATRARADLDHAIGSLTPDILSARCNMVAGDYWAVWPAVYHANLVLHERGERRIVLGVSLRSQPIDPQIKAVPRSELRVAVPKGDTLADGWMKTFGLPRMVEVARRRTIGVFLPVLKLPDAPALDSNRSPTGESPSAGEAP